MCMAHEKKYGMVCSAFLVHKDMGANHMSLVVLLENRYGARVVDEKKFAEEAMAFFEVMHSQGVIEPAKEEKP